MPSTYLVRIHHALSLQIRKYRYIFANVKIGGMEHLCTSEQAEYTSSFCTLSLGVYIDYRACICICLSKIKASDYVYVLALVSFSSTTTLAFEGWRVAGLLEVVMPDLVKVAAQVRGPCILASAPCQRERAALTCRQVPLQPLTRRRTEKQVEVQRAAVVCAPRLRKWRGR